MKRVLVLSPHTDDAEFACGGTIAKLLDLGHYIKWVTFVDRGYPVPEGWPEDTLVTEFVEAMQILGIADFTTLGFEVRCLEGAKKDIRNILYKIWKTFVPDIVFAPWNKARHPDHAAVGECTSQVVWKAVDVYFYALLNDRVGFIPNVISPLSQKYLDKKVRVGAAYKSQFLLRPWLTINPFSSMTEELLPFLKEPYPLVEAFQQERKIMYWGDESE
ncbi:MAG: PIG-L deacetylase family protein [Planctomycetota bacterium]|jgi:LmbE family N-acetylglucosaminyl deacetylase